MYSCNIKKCLVLLYPSFCRNVLCIYSGDLPCKVLTWPSGAILVFSAQGHLDRWTGGAENRSLLPPEPHSPSEGWCSPLVCLQNTVTSRHVDVSQLKDPNMSQICKKRSGWNVPNVLPVFLWSAALLSTIPIKIRTPWSRFDIHMDCNIVEVQKKENISTVNLDVSLALCRLPWLWNCLVVTSCFTSACVSIE